MRVANQVAKEGHGACSILYKSLVATVESKNRNGKYGDAKALREHPFGWIHQPGLHACIPFLAFPFTRKTRVDGFLHTISAPNFVHKYGRDGQRSHLRLSIGQPGRRSVTGKKGGGNDR